MALTSAASVFKYLKQRSGERGTMSTVDNEISDTEQTDLDHTSGCPRKGKLPACLRDSDFSPRCPVPGCNGRGHVNNNRATHRSESGCPIAALDRAMVKVQRARSADMHVVVMPESKNSSKAVISTCTEKELLKLAAKNIMKESNQVSLPLVVTRPKTGSSSDQEMEAQNPSNHQTGDHILETPVETVTSEQSTQSTASPSQVGRPWRLREGAPERPSILRRSSFKPRKNFLSDESLLNDVKASITTSPSSTE